MEDEIIFFFDFTSGEPWSFSQRENTRIFFAKFAHCHSIQQLFPFTGNWASQRLFCSYHLAPLKFKKTTVTNQWDILLLLEQVKLTEQEADIYPLNRIYGIYQNVNPCFRIIMPLSYLP